MDFLFIDQPNGGSINGIITVVSRLAELTDDETVFIPGHGQLSNRNDLLDYLEMLTTIRDQMQAYIQQGKTLEAIIETNLTEGYKATGVAAEDFIRLVYNSLKEGY